MDVLGIAILLVLVAGSIPSLYALIDAARRPSEAWATVNRSKPAWIVALLVLGLPAAIGYLALVRPALVLGRRRTPGAAPSERAV
ncbi:MAG: hypothetical protein JWO68_2300 [Actinomycetia bacterium]|nr:hypothetical protein [Actinomycetes bacterium]